MDALGAPCLLLKTGRKRRERVQRARLSLLEYSKTKPVLGRLQPLDRARAEVRPGATWRSTFRQFHGPHSARQPLPRRPPLDTGGVAGGAEAVQRVGDGADIQRLQAFDQVIRVHRISCC